MARSFDSGPGGSAASIAIESGDAAVTRIRRAAATGRQAEPIEAYYRVQSGHLYMANTFKDGSGKAYRGEVQKVLQTLRWDPIDGKLYALASDDQPGAETSADGGAPAAGRFGLGPEVANWLRERGLDQDLRDRSSPGLFLLELCSCITLDPKSGDGARPALDAQRARGKPKVYAASARFLWRRSYHLALPAAIGLGRDSDPADRWHAEGGQYEASAPVFDGPVWRRRPRQPAAAGRFVPTASRKAGSENTRPADSFDPRPAYLFDGLEAETADRLHPEIPAPGTGQGARFQPFVLRVGALASWPPNPLLRASVDAGRPGLSDNPEQNGLGAWYRPCPGSLTMSWQVSPRLDD